jgi:hypothetical protein
MDVGHAFRWWVTAVALNGAALVLLVVLTATHASSYGSTGGGATANGVGIELLVMVAVVVLARRMRAGVDWARTVLGAAALPIVAYLVLSGIEPVARGVSLVNLIRIGTATTRWLAAAAVVAGVVLMFRRSTRGHFSTSS